MPSGPDRQEARRIDHPRDRRDRYDRTERHERRMLVPMTSYYRAKARDIAPGRMLDDWLEETSAGDGAPDFER